MSYLVVCENGNEEIWLNKPHRVKPARIGCWTDDDGCYYHVEQYADLPIGSIKKLIGIEMTYNDEPFDLDSLKK